MANSTSVTSPAQLLAEWIAWRVTSVPLVPKRLRPACERKLTQLAAPLSD